MDENIISHVKRNHDLAIGERTAELIKITIGNAKPEKPYETMDIKGRDLISGRPKTLSIAADEIHSAIKEQVNAIVNIVRLALEAAPPELSADIVDQGIVLTGGEPCLKTLINILGKKQGYRLLWLMIPFLQ